MPPASKASPEEIQVAFHVDAPLKVVAVRLGVSPNRLRSIWKEHFGEAAFEARARRHQKSTPEGAVEKALRAFDTETPFKSVAKDLGMSPNTLRALWKRHFSDEAFRARSRATQLRGAEAYGARTAGRPKTKNFVSAVCDSCGVSLAPVTKLQRARSKALICETCQGLDRTCSVCGLACEGAKGLASHLARAVDGPHTQYKAEKAEARWAGLDGRDFVACRECDFRGLSLVNHIKLHGLTAKTYRARHPLASLVPSVVEAKRVASLMGFAAERAYGWTREGLLKFADERGRVIVAEAALALGASPATVLVYCRRLGLITRNKLAWQRVVLDQASKALAAPYEWEWSDRRIANPDTGRALHYDGFFPSLNLIVEAHGDQHFRYAEAWHGSLEHFHALRERDVFKRQRAEELGYRVLVVRPSDPTDDPDFWRRSLDTTGVGCVHAETDMDRVLADLRQTGFPESPPLEIELRKALTRLQGLEGFVDSQLVIRPYTTIGTTACGSFFPGRYHARYRGSQSAWEAWHDDAALRKAVQLQLDSGHPTSPQRVLRALVMYHRTPSVFRPAVAKFVYQRFAVNGVVWDPCSGYGGRLLGAMAAGVSLYMGTDIERATVEGNQRLAETLGVAARCKLVRHQAEDFDPEVGLDLVFTSPPYFDLEAYGATSNEAEREYATPQGWVQKFLRPVMRRAAQRLKPGGHLVLNLPQKPVRGLRLDLEALHIARELGLIEEPQLWMPVRTFKGTLKGEPLLIWKQSARG